MESDWFKSFRDMCSISFPGKPHKAHLCSSRRHEQRHGVGDITRSGLEGAFWSHITQLFIEESSFATASEEGFSSILPPDSGK